MTNTVVLYDEGMPAQIIGTASRKHAVVVFDGLDVRVTDLAATNGTFISTTPHVYTRLPPNVSTVLPPGARLLLGGTCKRVKGDEHPGKSLEHAVRVWVGCVCGCRHALGRAPLTPPPLLFPSLSTSW